ncbi:MAG: hypothetical protein GTO18_17880 [Anaerolineales bacterium]|nr:hypothetical protein [Anaerolineales bacterium]
MNRWHAISLILIGISILSLNVLYWTHERTSPSTDVSLPETLGDHPLVYAVYGQEAIDQVSQLHGKGFPLTSGAVGSYGNQNDLTAWIANAESSSAASELVAAMELKISQNSTPFETLGKFNKSGTTIFELVGMGQRHFYFQVGSLVIWIAAEPTIAGQALSDMLEAYQ